MQKNNVKKLLKAGRQVYGTSLTECFDAEFAVLLKTAGLDFFFVDTEHSPADYHEIQAICRSARGVGIVPMVRVTENVPFLITRALDIGAMGLVIPRVHTAEQAQMAVEMMKYPPHGRRGFGMRSTITDYRWTNAVEEMDSANHETMAVLQIESKEGLASVEPIARTPSVDVLFIGPYDLTISMGIAEQFQSAEFWNAVDRVIAACERAGISAGIQTGDMGILCEARRRGVRFLLYSNDVTVLFEGYRDAVTKLRAGADGQAATVRQG
jgi:2-keto-3-deoxy-L-rhamnonate aldolase RhmA